MNQQKQGENDDESYQQPMRRLARARVNCLPYSSQSGFIDKPFSSQSTCARARVREAHPAIRNPEAYFRAWRVAKFGGVISNRREGFALPRLISPTSLMLAVSSANAFLFIAHIVRYLRMVCQGARCLAEKFFVF